jgi:hypothetical protein
MENGNLDGADRNEMERVMKLLGLEVKKDLRDGEELKFEFIDKTLCNIEEVKPDRDTVINADDMDRLKIVTGLYETCKIDFDEYLERI